VAAVVPLALPARAQSVNLSKISPQLVADMTATPLALIPVIVEMAPASPPFAPGVNLALAQQAVTILNANGQPVGALPLIQAAAGYATSAGIQAMSQLPQVAAIEEDSVVRPRRSASSGSPLPGQFTSLYPREVRATQVWQQGGSGRGVTVAVLDSGIASNPDLGTRIQAEVSFAGPYDPQRPDPGGHGTHIAGTIAGDGTSSAGQYVGMAPHAGLVSVQVLDRNGNGRISSVVRGIEWAIAHQAEFNIRVLNLSFGARVLGASYRTDPLAAAVEIAWKHGIVVVAAAGNSGPSSGTVESPGVDPYVITVGATDDQATLSLSDDMLAWFSAWGMPTDSSPKPDLLADGRRIVSLRVPGSSIDMLLPDHVVTANNGSTYTRLTGTSMATAVVSGAVALMLERQPLLKPDQVKQILVQTTQAFGQSATAPPAGSAGAGLLDAYAATSSAARGSANQGLRVANGLARTLYPILFGQPLVWNSTTYLGTDWSLFTWLTLPWTSVAWDNIAWDNIAWDNIAWDNIAWDQTAWDNIAWDNIAWDNTEWNNIAWDSFNQD
jgi:serine protease AprX